MKRLISLLLVLMMLVSVVPQMGAAPSVMETEATEQAAIESPASDADEGADQSGALAGPAVSQFYRAKKLQEGDRVIIVCHSRNIALSAEYDGNYNAGVPVEPMDGIITSYDYSIVWTVGRYWDYYTFSYEGKNLSMEDQYYSMCLGERHDTWEILPGTTAGTFYVRNVDRRYNGKPLYIEWYEKLEQWDAYMNPTEELMTLSFYVYGSCYHVMDEGTVTKEATCTEAGTVLYSCEYCMETYTENVAPTGIHNYDNGICTVCGAEEPLIPDASGTTGEVSWAYYKNNATLVISGQGAMGDYTTSSSNYSPWYSYRNSIKKVVIEPGVVSIGEYAFYYLEKATEITIPDTVTTIGVGAFRHCDILPAITIPQSVVTIDAYAFSFCQSLTGIVIPDSVVTLGNHAFSCCYSLRNVSIGSGVTVIDNYAFELCYDLTDLNIGCSVTDIGVCAFDTCVSLQGVMIPHSVESIGNYAFAYCRALQWVKIGNGVSSIGYQAFEDCFALQEFCVEDDNPYYSIDDKGVLFDKTKETLVLYPTALEGEYVVPDGVKTIADSAFILNRGLTSIVIGDSVQVIEEFAFYKAENLKRVVLGDGMVTVQKQAFYMCPVLETVELGNSVETLGEYVFSGCVSLKSIVISDSVTSMDNFAFEDCESLADVRFGTGLKVISQSAFYGCNALTAVTIPEGVTTIGNSAFAECKHLIEVEFPNTLTTIGNNAFEDSIIYYITFPASLATIGDYAFGDNTHLHHVHFLGDMPTMGTRSFYELYDPGDGSLPMDPVNNICLYYIEGTIGWENCKYGTEVWDYTYYDHCDGEHYICNSCNTAYIVYGDGSHDWNEGEITKAPNCVTSGIRTYTCTTCGATEEEVLPANGVHDYEFYVCTVCEERDPNAPTLVSTIEINHTLNLESDIAINYLVREVLLREYDRFYMECFLPVYDGNKLVGTQTRIIEPVLRGEYYYFVLDGIIAPEMNNTVKSWIRMYDGEEALVSNVDQYSVASYAYRQLNDRSKPQGLKVLCANLLQYGSAVQSWKGYRTNALADWAMTREHRSYLTDLESVGFESSRKHCGDVAEATVTFRGISMQLGSKIAVRYIIDTANYEGDVADLSLRVSYMGSRGEAKEAVLTELSLYHPTMDYYVFDFDGLLASELRTVMTVAVYAGQTQVSETLEYSVDSYGVGREEPILTPVRAMIAYGDSAKAYFG